LPPTYLCYRVVPSTVRSKYHSAPTFIDLSQQRAESMTLRAQTGIALPALRSASRSDRVRRLTNARATVDHVGPALESMHEAAECDIEDRTHQQRQCPACEFIV